MAEQSLTEGYEADTSLIGMWLFLCTEVLFFGALFFAYFAYQHLYPLAMAEGVRRTDLTFGTINTVLLLTSSLTISLGIVQPRWMARGFVGAGVLGAAFLVLKGFEYAKDFQEGLFPGPGFIAVSPETGPEHIFFIFYFTATAIHALHMLIGLGLISYALKGKGAPVVVALYWSFVDIVWICLYPLLYLVGRGAG